MTVEQIAAFGAVIVSIITAIGAVIIGIKNGVLAKTIQADAVVKDRKLDQIHVLVNSRLSEALGKIEQLQDYVTKITGTPLRETEISMLPPSNPNPVIEKI